MTDVSRNDLAERVASSRVMRARYRARRQGYELQRRGEVYSIRDPWTDSLALEGASLEEAERWLSE